MLDNGTKNKLLLMLQKEHKEYHPLLALAEIATDTNDEGEFVNEVKVRIDCHKTIVKYVEAELKSVEVRGDVKADFGHMRVTIIGDNGSDDTEVVGEVISDSDET